MQGKFWEIIKYGQEIFSWHVQANAEEIKETSQILYFTSQNTFGIFTQIDDLILWKSVLLELRQELLHLNGITAEQVGEAPKNFHNLMTLNAVVYIEQFEYFFDNAFKVVDTDYFGAFKN